MSRFTIRQEAFGVIIYDSETFSFYTVDSDAYDILKDMSVKGSAAVIAEYDDEDVTGFISDLKEMGITDETLHPEDLRSLPLVPNSLTAPIKAYLTVTDRCNLRCKHCFGAFGNGHEMTLDQVRYVLDQLQEVGVTQIGLTGGEPFYHPQIFEIMKMIVDRGFTLQTTTNGTLINQEFIDAFREYGSSCFRLSLSFDGIPEFHDSIRGKGTFQKTMNNAHLLAENGISFGFNTVINKQNIFALNEFLDIMYDNHIYSGSYGLIVPTGRATVNNELLLGTDPLAVRNDIDWVKGCIRKFANRTGVTQYMYGATIHPDGSETRENSDLAVELGIKRCSAGVFIVTIAADGKLTPCVFMHSLLEAKGLKPESMFDKPLLDIWRNNECFRYARSLNAHPKCKECRHYMKGCTGGCPVDAYYYYGDENMHSQYCEEANGFSASAQ